MKTFESRAQNEWAIFLLVGTGPKVQKSVSAQDVVSNTTAIIYVDEEAGTNYWSWSGKDLLLHKAEVLKSVNHSFIIIKSWKLLSSNMNS